MVPLHFTVTNMCNCSSLQHLWRGKTHNSGLEPSSSLLCMHAHKEASPHKTPEDLETSFPQVKGQRSHTFSLRLLMNATQISD